MGPEPLDASLSADYLYEATRKRTQAIKQVIMDGKLLVGVGNIYASEALFRARIHPTTAANRISKQRCQRLQLAISKHFNLPLTPAGSTLRDYVNSRGDSGYFQLQHLVYDRTEQPLQVCGTPSGKSGGMRSTFFCPHCQNWYFIIKCLTL